MFLTRNLLSKVSRGNKNNLNLSIKSRFFNGVTGVTGVIDPEFLPFGGRVQYMSDLHLDHRYWDPVNSRAPHLTAIAPYLVIAGDLGNISTPIFREFIKNVHEDFDRVIFVPGNHEYYKQEYNNANFLMKEMEQQFPRLNVLLGSYQHSGKEDDGLQNNVVVLPLEGGAGVRVMGTPLWSEIPVDAKIRKVIEKNFKDYHKIMYRDDLTNENRLLTVNDTNFFHHTEVEWLKESYWSYILQQYDTKDKVELEKYDRIKNLIVTHHSPLVEECCHPKFIYKQTDGTLDRTTWYNWAFSTRLNWLIHDIQPDAWIFGHTHYQTAFKYKWFDEASAEHRHAIIASNPIVTSEYSGKQPRVAYHKISPANNRVL